MTALIYASALVGEALFPQLAPGVYRIVPTLNLGEITGLILRGGSVEVR